MADTDWGSPRPAKEWVRYNEDSKAKKWRELKVQQDGGKFIQTRRGWEWVYDSITQSPASLAPQRKAAKPKAAKKKKK